LNPTIFTRLSEANVNINYVNPPTINDVFTNYFFEFTAESLKSILIIYLTQESYYSQVNSGKDFIKFINSISQNYFGASYREIIGKYINPVVVTRQNVLLVLKKVYSSSFTGKRKITNINQLSHYFLKINLFEIENIRNSKDGTVTIEILKELISSLFRYTYVTNKSKLSLAELIRGHRLLCTIIQEPEGVIANELFRRNEGLDVIEKIELGYMLFVILYSKYTDNDFKNVLDFEKDFLRFNGSADKLIESLRKYLDSFNFDLTYEFKQNESLYDNYFFWLHPIEKISDNMFRIIDTGIYIERIFRNSFVNFENYYLNEPILKAQGKNLGLRQRVLGKAFENQSCKYIIEEMKLEKLDNKYSSGEEIADLIIAKNNEIVFFEIKAGYLPVKEMYEEIDSEKLVKILAKYGYQYLNTAEYSKLPKNKRKGIVQILHLFEKIKNMGSNDDFGTLKNKIRESSICYGIVVLQESALSIVGLNQLILKVNDTIMSTISNNGKIRCPFFIMINDLWKVKNGGIDLLSAIKKYSDYLIKDGLYSFTDFLNDEYDSPDEIGESDFKSFYEDIMRKYIVR
jgi:Holliday junction resolvase-like predicted endonuclease